MGGVKCSRGDAGDGGDVAVAADGEQGMSPPAILSCRYAILWCVYLTYELW